MKLMDMADVMVVMHRMSFMWCSYTKTCC